MRLANGFSLRRGGSPPLVAILFWRGVAPIPTLGPVSARVSEPECVEWKRAHLAAGTTARAAGFMTLCERGLPAGALACPRSGEAKTFSPYLLGRNHSPLRIVVTIGYLFPQQIHRGVCDLPEVSIRWSRDNPSGNPLVPECSAHIESSAHDPLARYQRLSQLRLV